MLTPKLDLTDTDWRAQGQRENKKTKNRELPDNLLSRFTDYIKQG